MDVRPDEELAADEPGVTVVEVDEGHGSELMARVEAWDAALLARDEAAARSLVAADFALELVQPVRNVMKRDVWLEVLADYVIHDFQVQDEIVDLDGDYAAVLRRVLMSATVMGEDRSGPFVLSDLWRRVDGEWRVWRRHSTPLSARFAGRQTDRH